MLFLSPKSKISGLRARPQAQRISGNTSDFGCQAWRTGWDVHKGLNNRQHCNSVLLSYIYKLHLPKNLTRVITAHASNQTLNRKPITLSAKASRTCIIKADRSGSSGLREFSRGPLTVWFLVIVGNLGMDFDDSPLRVPYSSPYNPFPTKNQTVHLPWFKGTYPGV